jgi:hypothetical protein
MAGLVTGWPDTPVGQAAGKELHLPDLGRELPPLGPGCEGPVATKRCPGCGQVKARSAFWRNARRSDGCATYCKDCGHRSSHQPPALLPTAPILPRLRVAVAGASYVGDPDWGVRRFARQMAATFGGDPEVFRVQLDRILRGDLTQISFTSADRLAIALGGSAPGFWRADW